MSNWCPRNVMQHRDRRSRQSIDDFPVGTTFEVFGPPAYKEAMERRNKDMRVYNTTHKNGGSMDAHAPFKPFSMYDSD